ncbi:MAG: polysaccharide biosynthesis/export family protein [Pseudomonadales bacterium]
MLKAFQILVFTLLASAACAQTASYVLNAGDTIRIRVYGEPDLSFNTFLVGHDGILAYPFIGDVQVAGKTAGEVQAALVERLQPDYLVAPQVSVGVVSYRPFFINGEVRGPGEVAFQPGLSLRKAVSLAGGFTERASKSSIFVISDNDASKESRKVDLNYQVQPGDIITIEQSFF